MRWAYDPEDNSLKKINDAFKFPTQLDLTNYLYVPTEQQKEAILKQEAEEKRAQKKRDNAKQKDSSSSSSSSQKKATNIPPPLSNSVSSSAVSQKFAFASLPPPHPLLYTLLSVLVHRGGAYGGHYVAFIQPHCAGKWYVFNDQHVDAVAEKEAVDENYGAAAAPRSLLGQLLGSAASVPSVPSSSSAYMLVYVRTDLIPHILAEVTEQDVPHHIARSLQAAREGKEELRFRVFTQSSLLLSPAVGSAPIFPTSGGIALSLPFRSTLSQLKIALASATDIPSSNLRVWRLMEQAASESERQRSAAHASLDQYSALKGKGSKRGGMLKPLSVIDFDSVAGDNAESEILVHLFPSSLNYLFVETDEDVDIHSPEQNTGNESTLLQRQNRNKSFDTNTSMQEEDDDLLTANSEDVYFVKMYDTDTHHIQYIGTVHKKKNYNQLIDLYPQIAQLMTSEWDRRRQEKQLLQHFQPDQNAENNNSSKQESSSSASEIEMESISQQSSNSSILQSDIPSFDYANIPSCESILLFSFSSAVGERLFWDMSFEDSALSVGDQILVQYYSENNKQLADTILQDCYVYDSNSSNSSSVLSSEEPPNFESLTLDIDDPSTSCLPADAYSSIENNSMSVSCREFGEPNTELFVLQINRQKLFSSFVEKLAEKTNTPPNHIKFWTMSYSGHLQELCMPEEDETADADSDSTEEQSEERAPVNSLHQTVADVVDPYHTYSSARVSSVYQSSIVFRILDIPRAVYESQSHFVLPVCASSGYTSLRELSVDISPQAECAELVEYIKMKLKESPLSAEGWNYSRECGKVAQKTKTNESITRDKAHSHTKEPNEKHGKKARKSQQETNSTQNQSEQLLSAADVDSLHIQLFAFPSQRVSSPYTLTSHQSITSFVSEGLGKKAVILPPELWSLNAETEKLISVYFVTPNMQTVVDFDRSFVIKYKRVCITCSFVDTCI